MILKSCSFKVLLTEQPFSLAKREKGWAGYMSLNRERINPRNYFLLFQTA